MNKMRQREASDLPKVTELVRSRLGILTSAVLPKSLNHCARMPLLEALLAPIPPITQQEFQTDPRSRGSWKAMKAKASTEKASRAWLRGSAAGMGPSYLLLLGGDRLPLDKCDL